VFEIERCELLQDFRPPFGYLDIARRPSGRSNRKIFSVLGLAFDDSSISNAVLVDGAVAGIATYAPRPDVSSVFLIFLLFFEVRVISIQLDTTSIRRSTYHTSTQLTRWKYAG